MQKPSIVRARFIGRDRSAGYRRGRTYTLRTWIDNRFIWVAPERPDLPEKVPYASIAAFCRSWQVVSPYDARKPQNDPHTVEATLDIDRPDVIRVYGDNQIRAYIDTKPKPELEHMTRLWNEGVYERRNADPDIGDWDDF